MRSQDRETTTIDAKFVRVTSNGYTVIFDVGLKSTLAIGVHLVDDGQFDYDNAIEGKTIQIEIPVWLAMKEGLI